MSADDIYRDDVVFKDPRNTLRGKQNYRRLFKGLRLFGRVCFTRCRVDVVRIWQPESNRISMRWQFHGVPRIPWEVEGILDGVSQFKLDKYVIHLRQYSLRSHACRGSESTLCLSFM